MKTIWKFGLKTTDRQAISMPIGAEILTVQTQNGVPCIWAIVDDSAQKELRGFEVFGTGHPMRQNEGETRRYIGTYQLQGGSLVFHVFEIIGDLKQ